MKEPLAMVRLSRLLPLLAVLASLVWGAAIRKASGLASYVLVFLAVNVRLIVEQRKEAKASVASA